MEISGHYKTVVCCHQPIAVDAQKGNMVRKSSILGWRAFVNSVNLSLSGSSDTGGDKAAGFGSYCCYWHNKCSIGSCWGYRRGVVFRKSVEMVESLLG